MKTKITLVLITMVSLNISIKAQNWSAVSTGVGTSSSSSVDVLAKYKNVLLAAGRYTSIKQWDGTTWSDFSTNSPSSTALFIDGDTIYSGGQSTGGSNSLLKYNGTSWAAFGNSNTYDSLSWNTNDKYSAIFKYNNNLYIAWSGAVMWFDPAIQKFRQAGNSLNDINQYTTNAKYAGTLNNKAYFTSAQNTLVWDGYTWDTLIYTGYSAAYSSGATVVNNELYLSGYFEKNAVIYPAIKYDGTSFSEIAGSPSYFTTFRENNYVLGTYYFAGTNYVGIVNGNNLVQLGNAMVTGNINAVAAYNNEIYAGGFFSSFAGVPANNIAKIEIPSVGIIPLTSQNIFQIFPNPANETVFIQSTEKITIITCHNYLGQFVDVKFENNTVDVSSLSKGLYFLTITSEKGTNTAQKFMKQ